MSALSSLPRLGWGLLAGITVFWGTNWVAIKIALVEIPIWQYRTTTCVTAGAALLTIAALNGQNIRLRGGIWRPMILGALFNVTGWNALVAYGVKLIPSGQASVLAFTMPIWATLLSAVFLNERLTRNTAIALLLVLGAIGALLSANLGALGASPIGMIMVLGAALSWATGTIVQKRVRWPLPVVAIAGWQLVIGAIPIALTAAATEPFMIARASPTALWALAYTILLPMLFCQYAWYKVVSLFPASIAAIGTVMVPVVGIFFGALVLGEPLGWRQVVALLCVVAALVLVLSQPTPTVPPAVD